MKSDDLRAQIKSLEVNIEKLKSSQSESAQRRAELEIQRKRHLVAARLKDAKAQQALNEIDRELEIAKRNEADDSESFAQLATELNGAEQSLAHAQFEERREELRRRLKALASGKKEKLLSKAVDDVLRLYAELVDDYEKAAAEVSQFDGRMSHEWKRIRELKDMQSDLIAARLHKIIRVQLSYVWINAIKDNTFEKNAQLVFDRADMEAGCLDPTIGDAA